jgi:ABC-2 type transport system permease protein
MPIGVVDEDDTEFSRALTAQLASSEALRVETLPRQESEDAVRRGRLAAFVVLREGYGDSMGFASETLQIGVDPARRAESAYLQGLLMGASFELLGGRFSDPDEFRPMLSKSRASLSEAEDLSPGQRLLYDHFLGELDGFLTGLKREEASGESQSLGFAGPEIEVVSIARDRSGEPRSSYEVMFPVALLWGVIGCTAGFAITLVKERRGGTHLRLLVSPLSRAHLLAGKGLACFFACLVVMTLLLLIGGIGFGVRLERPLFVAGALLATSVCFVGVMMLLATLGKTEEAVAGAGWATLMVMAMIGGAMLPRFLMPEWLQAVGNVSPIKWGIQAIEGAIWRGFSAAELAPVLGALVAIGTGCFMVGVLVLNRRDV